VLLRQAGIAFGERVLPFETPGWRTAIEALSPSRRVPALRHGDLVVWDSLAICEYVAELIPEAKLWPEDRAARALARSVSAEMHSGFSALREHMSMNIRARRPGKGRTAACLADIERIVTIWTDCRARFGGGGKFLFGRFGIADAMYAPVVLRFQTYDVKLEGAGHDYAEAVLALPALKAWVADAVAETERIEKFDLGE